VQENWSLLFAGFDDTGSPHIFVIAGSGNVEYCDFQGRAAIGPGSLATRLWMSFYGYASPMKLADQVFGSVSAKFFAERASDVGKETIVVVKTNWFRTRGCLPFRQS
jgi:20S proteasome alpha/beta subunit